VARSPQPRRITLGGREAVALTVEEYERLVASRRQIGGQSARVRALAQQARRTERLLTELETLTAPPAECTARTGDPPVDCLRCTIAALLRRHRDATA